VALEIDNEIFEALLQPLKTTPTSTAAIQTKRSLPILVDDEDDEDVVRPSTKPRKRRCCK
jgi:hypothetical protein